MRLQDELSEVELELQAQAGQVLHLLDLALDALAGHDPELADVVIEGDDVVDAGYLAIERTIQSLLARQTPVAVDLRLVLAALHINLHLERMADYCVTIAKLVKAASRFTPADSVLAVLDEMGHRAAEMTRVALDSFCFRDLAGAESLLELDELIDQANRRAVEEHLALASDPETREWSLLMLLVSRSLERIGDHAVDIGEQTAYLISGQFREFTDASGLATFD
jgi:phosphate transport system protein